MVNPAVWLMRGYPIDMGEPERVYQHSGQAKTTMILRLSVWLLLALVVGYLAIRISVDWTSSGGRDYEMLVILILMGIAFLVALSIPLLKRFQLYQSEAHDIAAMCPEGLAYFHNGIWLKVRWDDIASVESSRAIRTLSGDGYLWLIIDLPGRFLRGHIRHYVITTNAGDRINLGETLTGIDELMNTVQSKTWPMRLARAQEVLQSGQEVQFGPITITKTEGLTYNGKHLAWEAIDYIEEVSENTAGDNLIGDLFGDTKNLLRIKPRHTHPLKGIQSLVGIGDINIPKQDVPNDDVLVSVANAMISLTRQSEEQRAKRS